MEHKDYHIGILRGFIVAHKADPIVLHALDVVVSDARSRAGGLIGKADKEASRTEQHIETLHRVTTLGTQSVESKRYNQEEPDVFKHKTGENAKRKPWSNKDEDYIKENWGNQTAFEIALHLGRETSSIYNRIHIMKKEGRWEKANG